MARNQAVQYVPDRKGTAVFARGRDVSNISLRAAKAAASFMEAIAPVRRGPGGGAYRRGFEVEPTMVEVGGQQRAGAIIRNTAEHAHLVEYYNRDRVMSQGLDFLEQLSRSSGRRGR